MAIRVLVVQAQDLEDEEQARGMGQGIQAARGNGHQAVQDAEVTAAADEVIGQGGQRQPQATGGGACNARDDGSGEDTL